MSTPQGDMQMDVQALVRYPDAQRMVMKTAMGTITRVVAPEGAFMITPMGSQDMPGSQRDAALGELRGEMVNVLRNLDNPKYTFNAGATEGDARVLEINADGTIVKWHVDPNTGRILRTVTRASGPMPGDMVTELSEWKKFGDLNLPTVSVMTLNGQKMGEIRLASVQVNPAIDAKAFVKP
jgi:hypothetical protein